jgi:hypothetical protein
MGVRWLQCRAALVALVATLVLGIGSVGAQAQGAERGQVSQLYSQGEHAEALPNVERYVALARLRQGVEHMEFAAAIGWTAYVLAPRAAMPRPSRSLLPDAVEKWTRERTMRSKRSTGRLTGMANYDVRLISRE